MMNMHKVMMPSLALVFLACSAAGGLAQENLVLRKVEVTNARPEATDHEIASWMISEYAKQIAVAKLGKQKGTSEVVRQFADKLVKNHQLAISKFSKWATESDQVEQNLVMAEESTESDLTAWVNVHRDLNRETVRDLTRSLSQKTGKEFDQAFMEAQVRCHQGLKDSDRALATLASPACRSKIEECLEKDVEHFNEAQQIIKFLGSVTEQQTVQK